MDDMDKSTPAEADGFSLGDGIKAADLYKTLSGGQRESVCEMGRKMAELTIPSVFPESGYQPGDDVPGNNQSIGAQCLNTLTAHLEFMAFPPGQPIFRAEPEEQKVQEMVDEDPELWAKVELAMSRVELSHRKKFASFPLDTAYTGYTKLLLVAGNALWKHLKLQEPTFHRPDRYVVKRSGGGLPLLMILEEKLTFEGMDPDHINFIKSVASEDDSKAWEAAGKSDWDRQVTVHSVCRLRVHPDGEVTWRYWEEYEGHAIPDTKVETDADNPPMWAGWMVPHYGHDWGTSYCEEYRGDLYTVEAHASALNDGASLAALSLLLVKPGATTSIRQIREAKNLSTLPGDADDLSVFRTDKSADFNFVATNLEAASRRLSAAFLTQSAVVRQAERVTKEEVQRVGQELDKALGGLYTMIAQGNQKIIITRAVRLNEDEKDGPPELPADMVNITVVTGKDALGQSLEFESLVDLARASREAFPTSFEKHYDAGNYFTRLAATKGIKPDGLIRSSDQVAENDQAAQQQAMGASLMDKAAGPAAKGLTDMMVQQQAPQAQQQPAGTAGI